MPTVTDFRLSQFDSTKIDKCGKYIGHRTYWKLYAIENIFRVIVHSVLSVEIGPNWWEVAVDKTIQDTAERFKKQYLRKPWHTRPGSHDIYYIYLNHLSEIMRANANLFQQVVPDLDTWMLDIERLRLPRNVTAHMNFPSQTDMKRIDVFYDDCQKLIVEVQSKGKVALKIP